MSKNVAVDSKNTQQQITADTEGIPDLHTEYCTDTHLEEMESGLAGDGQHGFIQRVVTRHPDTGVAPGEKGETILLAREEEGVNNLNLRPQVNNQHLQQLIIQ